MPKVAAGKASTAKVAPKKPAAKKKVNGYQMPERIPLGEVLTDLSKQQWRIGVTIGSGGFGDIYCACKAESGKRVDDYPYVVKVEPHGNGPLFVEMHFYMRNGKLADIETFRKKRNLKSLGMPHFVGHGSHDLNKIKHRFVVMPRFGKDIWNLFLENNRKMPLQTVYRLAIQMLDVYEYIHASTYVHGDLKGSNILLGYGKTGESQAYLVDFGLASHYTTKDFKPDPKKMHNGTIEYTSRDAHQGVPTMRGDFEILAYNLIQWCGVPLPWEADKILGTPTKVQAAKEEFMKNLDSSLKKCFAGSGNTCPDPVTNFTKYVEKLKYNESPDYERCRKDFQNGLKSLGKSNMGDLEFKSSSSSKTTSSAVKENLKPSRRSAIKSPVKPDLSDITEKTEDVDYDESPKKKPSVAPKPRKRVQAPTDDSDEDDLYSKKMRGKTGKSKSTKTISASGSSGPTIVLNNEVNGSKSAKGKTYNLNFELDISFDANVVVNVKRKIKKTTVKKENDLRSPRPHKPSIQSTDEIAATEQSFAVGKAKVLKKAQKAARTSPRSNK